MRAVRQDADRVVVEADGSRWSARRVVVALPPAFAPRLTYEPIVPFDREQAQARMAMSQVVKVHAVYPEPFWRAQGLSRPAPVRPRAVNATFDNTPPSGRPGVLLGFVVGADALRFARQERAVRRRAVLATLARAFGRRAANPDSYVEHDWQAERWTRGGYFAHLPPGAWSQVGAALRRPFGRISCAGAETATRWFGYMDGAVEAGQRAAIEAQAD